MANLPERIVPIEGGRTFRIAIDPETFRVVLTVFEDPPIALTEIEACQLSIAIQDASRDAGQAKAKKEAKRG